MDHAADQHHIWYTNASTLNFLMDHMVTGHF